MTTLPTDGRVPYTGASRTFAEPTLSPRVMGWFRGQCGLPSRGVQDDFWRLYMRLRAAFD